MKDNRSNYKGNPHQLKLSIIVPVFNLQNWLSKTLENLISLELPYEYEIIVINDGSTDKSEQIIRSFHNKSSLIKLISIDNSGVSCARNTGIRYSSGEYITFVDGDDTVEKDYYKIAIEELDNGCYDFVQCNYRTIECNTYRYEQFVNEDRIITDNNEMIDSFFSSNKTIHNSVCSKVFRSSLLKNILFDQSLIIAEDQKFVFDVLLKSTKIKLLCMIGYNYYVRNTSAMHGKSILYYENILSVIKYFEENGIHTQSFCSLMTQKLYALCSLYNYKLCLGGDNNYYYSQIKEQFNRDAVTGLPKHIMIPLLLLNYLKPVYDFFVKLCNHKYYLP